MKKVLKLIALALALVMLCGAAAALADDEGKEPYGDGDGAVSSETLAALYNWLSSMDGDFRKTVTFDLVGEAVGAAGCVKDTDSTDTHAAYWTDGSKFVTITFRNNDGYWGITSITTDLASDVYSVADYSAFPHIGNCEAGTVPVEPVTLTVNLNGGSSKIDVTVELPTERWGGKVSFNEARIFNAPDISKASSMSSGIRIAVSASEEEWLKKRGDVENQADAESLTVLGNEMAGISYKKNGMDMTEYGFLTEDGLWISIQLYMIDVYEGSEAEAILNSLTWQIQE